METSLVINDGISVEWKTIVELQEAINHTKAVDLITSYASKDIPKTWINEVLKIHSIILNQINDSYAWTYRDSPIRIQWSSRVLPNYAKIPDLMQSWEERFLQDAKDLIFVGIQAYYDLVTIHPFIDGNGRTARLFMNLILQTQWHPLISIEVEDRQQYIETLESTQLGWDYSEYEDMMLNFIVWNYNS